MKKLENLLDFIFNNAQTDKIFQEYCKSYSYFTDEEKESIDDSIKEFYPNFKTLYDYFKLENYSKNYSDYPGIFNYDELYNLCNDLNKYFPSITLGDIKNGFSSFLSEVQPDLRTKKELKGLVIRIWKTLKIRRTGPAWIYDIIILTGLSYRIEREVVHYRFNGRMVHYDKYRIIRNGNKRQKEA